MITEPITQANDLFATANSCLLTPHEIDAAGLQQVFGQMFVHHVDYADLYFQYTRAEGWALEEGIVKSGSFNIDQGVGVRAVSGEKTAFAYSDDISMPALASAAQATRAIARQGAAQSVQAVRRSRGRPAAEASPVACQRSSGPSPAIRAVKFGEPGNPISLVTIPPCGSAAVRSSFRLSLSGR